MLVLEIHIRSQSKKSIFELRCFLIVFFFKKMLQKLIYTIWGGSNGFANHSRRLFRFFQFLLYHSVETPNFRKHDARCGLADQNNLRTIASE